MPSSLFILISLLIYLPASSQSEIVLEQYCFIRKESYTVMPVAHFQTRNYWYAEARYNYEEAKTFSLYLGKSFVKNTSLSYKVTPMLGGSMGRFKSISAGLNIELDYRSISFSCQSQYSYSVTNFLNSFLYNWSELTYQPVHWFYSGLSVQQTRLYRTSVQFEPGVLAGFSFRNFTIPAYCFSLFNPNRYYIVGVNYKLK